MTTDPKTDTLWRTYLVDFRVLIFGIAIIAKIIVVQTKDNKELEKLAEQREYRVDTLEASRGNIFSSDGQLMATTIPLYDVFFDYKSVDSAFLADNIDSLCGQMASLFPKRNREQWKAFFAEGRAKKNRHYKIALNITQTELRQMQQFVIFNRGLYKNGLKDFTAVIDAQRSLLSLEESLVISRGQITIDLISLYKALGGGIISD